MSYETIDKLDWHYCAANFPNELRAEAGATHIGMFVAWVLNNNLEAEKYKYDTSVNEFVCDVKSRKMTGRDFLCEVICEKLCEYDLSREGLEFVRYYYTENFKYFNDYEEALVKTLPSSYYVADSWENYDKIAKYIDLAFKNWRESNSMSKK